MSPKRCIESNRVFSPLSTLLFFFKNYFLGKKIVKHEAGKRVYAVSVEYEENVVRNGKSLKNKLQNGERRSK